MKTKIILIAVVTSMASFNVNAQTKAEFGVKDSKYVYEQDFNSLPKINNETGSAYYTYINSGSEGTVNIPGWYVTTANATPTYGTGLKCDNGSFFTGTSIFSYGSMTLVKGGVSGENRTLGGIAGKNGWIYLGILLENNTGSTVNTLTVKFAGETWRLGCETNKANGSLSCDLVFAPEFADAANFYISPAFIPLGTLIENMSYKSSLTGAADATITTALGLNVDGHDNLNRTVITHTLTDMNWAAGKTLLIRWGLSNVPYDASKNIYAQWGLGIDDISATIGDVIPAGIKDKTVNAFKVYKNGQSLCVNGETGEVVKIYNICGKLVKTINLSGKEETVSGLNKEALYLLKGKTSSVKVVY